MCSRLCSDSIPIDIIKNTMTCKGNVEGEEEDN